MKEKRIGDNYINKKFREKLKTNIFGIMMCKNKISLIIFCKKEDILKMMFCT